MPEGIRKIIGEGCEKRQKSRDEKERIRRIKKGKERKLKFKDMRKVIRKLSKRKAVRKDELLNEI